MSYSFFTPIVPQKNCITSSTDQSVSCYLASGAISGWVDEYLAWGNTYVVIDTLQMESGSKTASLQKRENSWVGMVFKVITYMTVVLPLLALVLKCLFRMCTNVKITKDYTIEPISENNQNQIGGKPTSAVI